MKNLAYAKEQSARRLFIFHSSFFILPLTASKLIIFALTRKICKQKEPKN
jgi:hypothetical protein